jgi:hypothetical protein
VNQPSLSASALLDARLGLFRGNDFVISTGCISNSAVIDQALWYFRDEVIAVPRADLPVAGYTTRVTAMQDVVDWARSHNFSAPIDYPPLLWLAARDIVRGARLSSDGSRINGSGGDYAFGIVPKIALNRSYYNEASVAFFAARSTTIRGHRDGERFIARTIWPDDFRLDFAAPMRRIEATPLALRALVREQPRGGAQSAFSATALWERDPGGRDWTDKPVLAIVLNGAQGDDDEAHGGHFALTTGYVGGDGAIGDWLANNFYTLDSFSEKGIIAAMLPLDNYLADLNSGQSWYRPSYVLVAVLRDARAAAHIQGALARVYNQFYRHQLVYRHATMNCASISVDVLRSLGWNVVDRGPTSRLLAAVSAPYNALRERSADKAVQLFDYLTEDRTRLFPAAAFEEIGADLLRLATGELRRTPSAFEALIAQDLEAIVLLRVPQLPSSRAWGDCPVVTMQEYHKRIPSDPTEQQLIPVPLRPFPQRLRDPDLLPAAQSRGEIALSLWAVLSIVGIPWLVWRLWRRRTAVREDSPGSAQVAPAANVPHRPDPK